MKPLLLAFNLLCGADSLTTHVALHSGHFHEAVVPFGQNPWVLDATNAAQCTAVTVLTPKLPRKIGIPVLVAATVARAWVVQHNTRLMVAR